MNYNTKFKNLINFIYNKKNSMNKKNNSSIKMINHKYRKLMI